MEGHILPDLHLSSKTFHHGFQQSSKRAISERFFPTQKLERFGEHQPPKQKDVWIDVFYKIFYTSTHLIRHVAH